MRTSYHKKTVLRLKDRYHSNTRPLHAVVFALFLALGLLASTAAPPAKSCRIRLLYAFHKEPLFSTSQIVPDRLRSSEIVWDRPSAPPPIARNSRRIAEMFARFRPPNRQKGASKRVVSRQNTSRRARGKKQCSISPDHTEVHPTWHDRTCRQTVKKRPSTPIKSASTSVGRNFFGATFGDIGGHMSHSRAQRRPGTHCRARPANLWPTRSHFTRPNMHANSQKMATNDNQIGTVHPREKLFYWSTLADFGRLLSTFVDPDRPPAAAPAPAAPGTHTGCPARTPRRSPAAATHRPTPPAASPTSRSPGHAQPVAEG